MKLWKDILPVKSHLVRKHELMLSKLNTTYLTTYFFVLMIKLKLNLINLSHNVFCFISRIRILYTI